MLRMVFQPVLALVCVLAFVLPARAAGSQDELLSALSALTGDVSGGKKLSEADIARQIDVLEKDKESFGQSEAVMRAAIGFVTAHDAHFPCLFKTKRVEWGKDRGPGRRWAVFLSMQYLIDYAYTPANLARYPDLLGRTKFATADYFPGPVAKPADPNQEYSVEVWGSFPHKPAYDIWMKPWSATARIATGAYLAPGTVVTVSVPPSLVNKGYQFRVGANSYNFQRKKVVNRLYRVSLLYPITSTQVQLASPLGGLIDLEVPVGAQAGAVKLTFKNVVRAPLFVNTQTHQTTDQEWRDVEAKYPAPWAEFQTKAFFLQVPRNWVYNLKDPAGLMEQWDKAVTAVCHVMGYSIDDLGRVALYLQPDTQLKASVFSPGYPQVNVGGVLPGDDRFNGLNMTSYYLRGPAHVPDWVFHEWGHALNLTNPAGEMESSNNFLHVVAQNLGLGIDLEQAFSNSRGGNNPFCTLDNTAIHWMTNKNFTGGVMAVAQKAYQLQGHAKYVDIARLFGWETLARFYHMVQVERAEDLQSTGRVDTRWPKNVSADYFNLRLSESSGIDMRPLFAFWGTPPDSMVILDTTPADLQAKIAAAKANLAKVRAGHADPNAVQKAQGQVTQAQAALARYPQHLAAARQYARQFDQLIQSGKIKRSAKIYDLLEKYKSLVPPDNAAYRKFALAWYTHWKGAPPVGKHMFWAEKDHAELWNEYHAQTAQNLRAFVQHLISTYFPDGRPKDM